MANHDWPTMVAKTFAVLSFSTGAGFLAGAIAFLNVGEHGRIYGGPFTHVADIIGWGTGFLTASLATFATLALGRRREHGLTGKPVGLRSGDEL
jgi:hypothetical protein